MAKKTASVETPSIELTARTQNLIDAIRKPFGSFVSAFAALEEKRSDLAPKFMKAYRAWASEADAGFTDFVRFLTPELADADTKTIRASRAWQSADYLKRLDDKQRRAKERSARGEVDPASVDRPATAAQAFPRVLASFVSMIPEDARMRFWETLGAEMHWDSQQIAKIQTSIKDAVPAVIVKAKIDRVRLSQPEHVAPQIAAAA